MRFGPTFCVIRTILCGKFCADTEDDYEDKLRSKVVSFEIRLLKSEQERAFTDTRLMQFNIIFFCFFLFSFGILKKPRNFM